MNVQRKSCRKKDNFAIELHELQKNQLKVFERYED